jgi:hypothetical protein
MLITSMVSSGATVWKRTNAKLSTSLHSAATGSRYPVLTSLHSLHSNHTSRTRYHPWRPLNYSSCRVSHPRLSAPTFSRNHNHRASFRNLLPTRKPHTLAATTAATHTYRRATMLPPLKRKRAEDVDPPVKESQRRLNAFRPWMKPRSASLTTGSVIQSVSVLAESSHSISLEF